MARFQIIPFIAAVALAACAKSGGGNPNATSVRVEVSPLSLQNIVDAEYTLAVWNGDNELVWEKTGLRSTRYGNGEGDLAFVGPCDGDANDNRVELTITALYELGDPNPITDWQNPTAVGPLVQSFTCVPNRDVPVTFNVTILRQANQGFFDIGVTFDDIFCSAKLDCVDDLPAPAAAVHRRRRAPRRRPRPAHPGSPR